MSARTDLLAKIKAYAGVSSALSGRIYPDAARAGTAEPYAIESWPSNPPTHHLDGSDAISFALYQVTVWSSLRSEAEAGADAIVAAVKDFAGTSGSTWFQKIRLDDRRDVSAPAGDGSERVMRGVLLAFSVTHNRP